MEQKTLISIVCLIASVRALSLTRAFFVPVLLGIFFALVRETVISRGEKKGLTRNMSVVVLTVGFLLIIGLIYGVIATYIPSLSVLQDFATDMREQINTFLSQYISSDLAAIATSAQDSIMQAFSSVGGIATGGVIVVVVMYLLLLFKKKIVVFRSLKTKESVGKIQNLYNKIAINMGKYFLGLLGASLILGILYSLVLRFFGVPYAFLLGATGAMFAIIPSVGTLLGEVVMTIATLATLGWSSAGWVLLSFIAIQGVDEYIFTPRLRGGAIEISTLATLLGVIIGGLLWGPLGIFLALPILGIMRILCEHYGEKDRLVLLEK